MFTILSVIIILLFIKFGRKVFEKKDQYSKMKSIIENICLALITDITFM